MVVWFTEVTKKVKVWICPNCKKEYPLADWEPRNHSKETIDEFAARVLAYKCTTCGKILCRACMVNFTFSLDRFWNEQVIEHTLPFSLPFKRGDVFCSGDAGTIETKLWNAGVREVKP